MLANSKIEKAIINTGYTPEELAAIRKYEQKLQNDVMKMIRDFWNSSRRERNEYTIIMD